MYVRGVLLTIIEQLDVRKYSSGFIITNSPFLNQEWRKNRNPVMVVTTFVKSDELVFDRSSDYFQK